MTRNALSSSRKRKAPSQRRFWDRIAFHMMYVKQLIASMEEREWKLAPPVLVRSQTKYRLMKVDWESRHSPCRFPLRVRLN